MSSTAKENIKDFTNVKMVFEKYADMVYRLAFVRTKSESDSDDVLQEVFLRYMKVSNKIESDEHAKAMLLRITVNCSKSLLTSSWFKKTEPLNDTLSYTDNVSEGSVLSEVLKLPTKLRTAVHLHYYCGYSVKEIAGIEGINESTVKTHLSRARAILKETLKEEI